MFVADVRVFIEHHLEPGVVSRPSILHDLHTMGIRVAIHPSHGDVPGVILEAGGFEVELRITSYNQAAVDVTNSGGAFRDDDEVSWVVADSDLAVALAQLVAEEDQIEASVMLGHFNRWYESLQLVKHHEL